MEPKIAIGNRISQARIELGYNQSELARYVDVSAQAVQQWEKGDTSPRGKNLERVAEFLQTSAKFIQFGEAQDKTDNVQQLNRLMKTKMFENMFHQAIVQMLENGTEMGWSNYQSKAILKPLGDLGLMHLRKLGDRRDADRPKEDDDQ